MRDERKTTALAFMAELFTTALNSDSNLQLYYRLAANSNDSTANARHGTDTGSPTYSSGNGKFGNGVGFNGSSQYISIPYFPWGTNSFSVSLWFKNNSDTVFSLFGVNNGGGSGVGVDYGGDGGAGIFSFTKSGITNITYAWTADNNWHHLAAVQHASNGMKLYLDGVEVATGGNTANIIDPSGTLHIGRRNLTNNQYFTGAIDDFSIFNRALTAGEVTTLASTSITYTRSITPTAAAVLALSRARTTLKSLAQTALGVLSLTKARITLFSPSVTSAATLALTKSAIYLKTLSLAGGTSNSAAMSPGTAADDATVGTISWTNPNNAKVSDGSFATQATTGTSHYLKLTNFGFALAPDATPVGIYAEILRKRGGDTAGTAKDSAVRIVKPNGSFGTTNKADTSTNWPTTAAYASYGGPADLWSETWSYTDINDEDFGLVLSAANTPADGPCVPSVDHARITVYYTQPGIQGVVSITKGLVKLTTLSATSLAVLALSGLREYLRSLSVTASASVLLARVATFSRSLSLTAAASLVLTPISTFYRTLAQTAAAVPDLAQQFISGIVSIGLSVTATASVGFARLISLSKTVTAMAVLSLVRMRFLALAVTSAATLAIQKTVLKTLAIAVLAETLLAKGLVSLRSLAASATASISLTRIKTILSSLTVTASVTVSLAKGLLYTATLSVAATVLPSIIRIAIHTVTFAITARAWLRMYVNGLRSFYSRKYQEQGTSYSAKHTPQATTYTRKHEPKGTSYENKYPS
jgi:hypothetical protein